MKSLEARADRAKANLAGTRRQLSDHLSAGGEMEGALSRLESSMRCLDGAMLTHILVHHSRMPAIQQGVTKNLTEARAALSLLRLAKRRSLDAVKQERLLESKSELSELIANSALASPPQANRI